MTYVQFGRDLQEHEIVIRLIMAMADNLTKPVHFVPPVAILPATQEWPVRGVLHA